MATTMRTRRMTMTTVISVSIRPPQMLEQRPQSQPLLEMKKSTEYNTISRMSRMKGTKRMMTTVMRRENKWNSNNCRMTRKVARVLTLQHLVISLMKRRQRVPLMIKSRKVRNTNPITTTTTEIITNQEEATEVAEATIEVNTEVTIEAVIEVAEVVMITTAEATITTTVEVEVVTPTRIDTKGISSNNSKMLKVVIKANNKRAAPLLTTSRDRVKSTNNCNNKEPITIEATIAATTSTEVLTNVVASEAIVAIIKAATETMLTVVLMLSIETNSKYILFSNIAF